MIISRKHWVTLFFLYLTVIFSTSLHMGFGKENTVDMGFFINPKPELQTHYPDQGMLSEYKKDHLISESSEDFWKLGGASTDSAYYLLQVHDFDQSIAPYRYRIFPTIIARAIHQITQKPVPFAFILINLVATLIAAIIFTKMLVTYWGFSLQTSVFGSLLFITMVGTTRTLSFPMIDPLASLFILLILKSVFDKNVGAFLLWSTLGVATKEILVVSAIMWGIQFVDFNNLQNSIKKLWVCFLPILVFMSIRTYMGGGVLEVNYGYNVSEGEFPKYYKRLLNGDDLKDLVGMVFLSFSFLWFGLKNWKLSPFMKKQLLIIPIIITTAVLLSGNITRVLGILFPFIIPLYLHSLAKVFQNNHATDKTP